MPRLSKNSLRCFDNFDISGFDCLCREPGVRTVGIEEERGNGGWQCWIEMKTFGQVITEARKKAGLTQKEVAGRLKRDDGRSIDPPYLNSVEHDRRNPPPNYLIEQLAKILKISPDVLYFYANRLPADIKREAEHRQVEAAYQAFRKALKGTKPGKKHR